MTIVMAAMTGDHEAPVVDDRQERRAEQPQDQREAGRLRGRREVAVIGIGAPS